MNDHSTIPHTTPAWAWVLQHAKIIDAMAKRFALGTSIPRDELRAELICDLGEQYHRFDSSRGSVFTFVYLRAKRVRRGLVRQSVRNTGAPLDLAREDGPVMVSPVRVGGRGNHERTEAIAAVVEFLEVATPEQREAAKSVLLGLDARDVRKRYGWTMKQRDAILRPETPLEASCQ